jgi:hypothetical protein
MPVGMGKGTGMGSSIISSRTRIIIKGSVSDSGHPIGSPILPKN